MKLKNALILLLTATIWGVAFVAQSVGMDYVGPYTFTCVRSFIGGLFLIPCIALLNRLEPRLPRRHQALRTRNRRTSSGSAACAAV